MFYHCYLVVLRGICFWNWFFPSTNIYFIIRIHSTLFYASYYMRKAMNHSYMPHSSITKALKNLHSNSIETQYSQKITLLLFDITCSGRPFTWQEKNYDTGNREILVIVIYLFIETYLIHLYKIQITVDNKTASL